MGSLVPPISDMVTTSDGERLFVAEWPGSGPPLLFSPGLTSTHRNVAAVAREIDGQLRVISFDCRGRGNSTKPPPGSYGMDRHGRDMLEIMDALGIERAIVSGHSMGAYVACSAAVLAPDRAMGLVLLDGGVFSSPPGLEDLDPDMLMQTMLKPVIDRLSTTYATIDDYFAFWRDSEYTTDGDWGEILEDYALYDLGITPDGYQPKCDPDAAKEDWTDLLANAGTRDRLAKVECPVLAVGAEFGLTPSQPSVLGEPQQETLKSTIPDSRFVQVPNTTHHTVTLTERGAKATAEAIVKFAAGLS